MEKSQKIKKQITVLRKALKTLAKENAMLRARQIEQEIKAQEERVYLEELKNTFTKEQYEAI